jgi:hypothetical protein
MFFFKLLVRKTMLKQKLWVQTYAIYVVADVDLFIDVMSSIITGPHGKEDNVLSSYFLEGENSLERTSFTNHVWNFTISPSRGLTSRFKGWMEWIGTPRFHPIVSHVHLLQEIAKYVIKEV